MQHARQHEIGDELPLADQQPMIFPPQQGTPNVRHVIHGVDPDNR
jgi:hypothetical protein